MRFCEFQVASGVALVPSNYYQKKSYLPVTASASTGSVSARSQEWVTVQVKEEEEEEAEATDVSKERGHLTMGRETSPKRKSTSSNFTGQPKKKED